MELGGWLLLSLIMVPMVGGAACLGLGRVLRLRAGVIVTSALTILLGLLLFIYMTWNGLASISVTAAEIAPFGDIMLVADFALMFVFLYSGYKERSALVVLFALAQLIPLTWFEFFLRGDMQDPGLMVDFLGVMMALITSIIGSIICIYAIKYMEHDAHQPRFFAVMLLFLGVMNGAIFSNDLLWLLVFWETTTVCSYLLIRHEGTADAIRSGLRALTYTLGGGVALVFAIILLYHYSGTTLLSQLPSGSAISGLALIPIGLFALAAFTKSAQLPFQNWLLGAMVAPTPVSALLHSSTMVNLGVYLLLRLSPSFSPIPELQYAVGLVGGVSFLATSVLAIGQSSSKKVLAYSTIGNLGLIVLCAAIGTKEAIYAGMLLLLFHAISKALLFMAVGVVKHETGSEDIEPMDGLRDKMPFVTFALFVGVITLLLPPFGMFASKWMVSEISANYPLFAFLLAVGFGASVVYYGKWLGRTFSAGPMRARQSAIDQPLSSYFKWTLLVLMAGAVGLSFLISQVVTYLILPYLGPLPFGILFVSGALGTFPMFALLVVIVVTLTALALLSGSGKAEITDAYTGGEPFVFANSGAYFFSEETAGKAIVLINVVAILLLISLFLFPAMQEVGLWTI